MLSAASLPASLAREARRFSVMDGAHSPSISPHARPRSPRDLPLHTCEPVPGLWRRAMAAATATPRVAAVAADQKLRDALSEALAILEQARDLARSRPISPALGRCLACARKVALDLD